MHTDDRAPADAVRAGRPTAAAQRAWDRLGPPRWSALATLGVLACVATLAATLMLDRGPSDPALDVAAHVVPDRSTDDRASSHHDEAEAATAADPGPPGPVAGSPPGPRANPEGVEPADPGPSTADTVPSGDFVMHEEYLESLDGTTLHAYVYRPAWVGDAPTPVQLTISPYSNSGGTINGLNPDPLREPGHNGGSLGHSPRTFLEGYTAVVVTLRGRGGSRGCTDLGGPREQGDARAAVEWARNQPWSNGKVGVTGLSYPGLAALMTLALRDADYQGPDAIVFAAAPTGYEQFFENRVPQQLFGTLPIGWWINYRGTHLIPPSLPSGTEQMQNHLLGLTDDPGCDLETVLGNIDPDPSTAYWAARDMPSLVAGAEVPVLGFHGFDDPGVPAKQLFPVMEALAGPWQALIGPWAHVPAGPRSARDDLVYSWLDHHLKGEQLGHPLEGADRWLVQTPDGAWRGEAVWPPADAEPWEVPVLPGTYLDAHGNQSDSDPPENVGRRLPVPSLPLQGSGVWTFTPPLSHDVHLSGRAGLRLELAALLPGAHVFGMLYELSPDGRATFITRGAATVPGFGAAQVAFELRPHDWKLSAGNRLGLLITGADDWHYGSGNTLQPVQLRSGVLSLPVLPDRTPVELPPDTVGFLPWERPAPFDVDATTISGRTVDVAPPTAGT